MPQKSQQNKFSAVKEIPRSKIVTRRELFQGRQSKWSQETVDKIVREGFDKSREPIITWYDEQTGEHVVVSGHSRFEASRILFSEGDKSLETLPIKVFQGDLEEAIEYAMLESNRSSTSEGLLSDIEAFKLARDKGCAGECLRGYFKTNAYINSLQRLSNLNTKGLFLEKLSSEAEAKSFPNLKKYAEWIGELRKQYSQLTNSHENEVFNYLYLSGKKKLPIKKEDFVQPIERVLTNFFFNENKPLNLQNFASKTPYSIAADAQKKELQQKIYDAEKRIKQLRGLIAKARKENKQKLVTQFEEEIARRNKEIIAHNERIEKVSQDAKQAEKQAPSLFDNLSEPEEEQDQTPLPEKETLTEVKENEPDQPEEITDIELINYSDKSVVLMGNTKPYAQQLGRRGLNGRFNGRLTHPETNERFAGWVFSVNKREEVEAFLKTREVVEQDKSTGTSKNSYEPKIKLPFRQHLEAIAIIISEKQGMKDDNYHFPGLGETVDFSTQSYHDIYLNGRVVDVDSDVYSVTYTVKTYYKEGVIYVCTEQARITFQSLHHGKKVLKIAKSGKVSDGKIEDVEGLEEVKIPTRIFIPKDKRGPHYDLSKKPKLRADVLRQEVMLGKMEIALNGQFDGMTDSWSSVSKKEWFLPKASELPYVFYSEIPRHWNDGEIIWGNAGVDYLVRYANNKISAYIEFDENRELSKEEKEKERLSRANKFKNKAETLRRWSEKKKEQLKTKKRHTPKKNKEYKQKEIEAEIEEETAEIYEKVAKALEDNTLSGTLDRVFLSPNENPVYFFLRQQSSNGGYYDAFRAMEPKYQEYDDFPRYMATNGEKYGLNSFEDWDDTYNELQTLLGGEEKKTKDEEKQRSQRLRELIDEWRFSKQDGFHPTPKDIIEQMLYKAEIMPDSKVLEPSAGLGDIAEAIRKNHPENPIEVVEKFSSLKEILRLKGFDVVGSDTLAHHKKYDRALMNPPFEKHQDIAHVQHVYEHNLKPGGRLVAIMSRGSFDKNSRLKVRKSFNEWLDEVGAYTQELDDDAFKSSFRPTGVRTNIVVINKPEEELSRPPHLPKEQLKNEENSAKLKALAFAKAKEKERKRRLRLIQI